MWLLACGPKPPIAPKPIPVSHIPAPFNLRADAFNGKAMLFWSIDRKDGIPISGYNIYLAELRRDDDTLTWKMSQPEPHNDFPYPGDTDGDINSESITIERLQDGHTYMAMVRAVGMNRTRSEPSNVIVFEPLARGDFVISTNRLADDGGFNFERGVSVPGKDPRNDIYLYATADKIGLSSPSRLGAGLRKTEFFLSGENVTPLETITIETGNTITLKTKHGLATVAIAEISGQYPNIRVGIKYQYRPDKR